MKQEEKNTMIERIVSRYVSMNERDYSDGILDKKVKEDCNNFAKAFGNTLKTISDESLSKFYNASRKLQEKVFAYDSMCWSAITMPPSIVQNCYEIVVADMEKYGFDKMAFVTEIMTPHLNNLRSMLDAEFIDVGDGAFAYVGLKGAMI